ncbi:MAG TPA: hypothetical protein VJ957_10860 [Longimicrobiales bacterium]|nr:hypothetical protein [Longimicrobiales bacterium]
MLPVRTRRLLGLAGVFFYLCYLSAYLPGAHHCAEDGLVVQNHAAAARHHGVEYDPYDPGIASHPSAAHRPRHGHRGTPGDDPDDDCHCVGPCTADIVAITPAGAPPAPVADLLPVPPGHAPPDMAPPPSPFSHRQPPANAPPRLA